MRFCPEPAAVVYSREGRIKWFTKSAAFEELHVYIEKNVRLDPLSCAARVGDSQQHHSHRRVPASAWFAKGRHNDDAEILEHSQYIALYDAVLTLLWVDDDIVADDDSMWGY